MSQTQRLFIAVDPPAEVRAATASLIERLARTRAKVKWVAAPDLHVTMHFLGEVNVRKLPALCEEIAHAAASCLMFRARAKGLGAFPELKNPRTVWLGMSEGGEGFAALHAALAEPVRRLGGRMESRRFLPHITLGRVRAAERISDLLERLESERTVDAGSFLVRETVLYSSELRPEGPHYELVARASLTKG